MNDIIAGGDSQQGSEVMGLGIDLATGQVPAPTTDQPGEAIQQNPLTVQTVGSETVPPTEAIGTTGQEGKAPDAPESPYTAEYYQAKRNTVVALEQYFKDLQGGRITDVELRKIFDENPTLVEAAKKSKQLKDRFRNLMERDSAIKHDDNVAARRKSQLEDVEGDDLDTEERSKSADPGSRRLPDEPKNGLSTKDERIAEAIYQKLRSEGIREKAETLAEQARLMKEKTAAQYGFKDQEYDNFSRLVDSIHSGMEDADLATAISHAITILRPSKGSPVNLSGSMPNADIPDPSLGFNADAPVEIISIKPTQKRW